MSGPNRTLYTAIRKVLIEDVILAAAGVYFKRPPGVDELPSVVVDVMSATVTRAMGPIDAWRSYVVVVKAIAIEDGGASALSIADPLCEAARMMLVESVGGEDGAARLNRYLAPLGYEVMIPLETGEVLPYVDYVGKDAETERWHVGYHFDLKLQKLS